jgi:hypothetical protein
VGLLVLIKRNQNSDGEVHSLGVPCCSFLKKNQKQWLCEAYSSVGVQYCKRTKTKRKRTKTNGTARLFIIKDQPEVLFMPGLCD